MEACNVASVAAVVAFVAAVVAARELAAVLAARAIELAPSPRKKFPITAINTTMNVARGEYCRISFISVSPVLKD
jgi:archaellum component FlaG (FlaF/FlaG flagellin family)